MTGSTSGPRSTPDSRHYLSLAEHGYQTTGNERLLLVFFRSIRSLYGYATTFFKFPGIRPVRLQRDVLFAGYLLYELALLDTDRRGALRAVKYLCILPASCLFCAPMSDSLFLFLTVAGIYLARKKQYVFASILGFFSALTRLPGVLLFAPVCFELVGDLIREHRAGASGRK